MAQLMKKFLYALFVIGSLASCAGYHVRKGDQAYALLAYAKAQRHYERVIDRTHDRAVLLRAADACRRQNELVLADLHYQRADSLSKLSGDDALHYGQVLMGLGRASSAEACFLRVLKERPEDAAALDLYGSCQGFRSFFADSERFVVNALTLPGMRATFSAVPYKHGLLVAGEQDAPKAKADPWSGSSFLDLYYCEKKTIVTWLPAAPLPGIVNGPFHEGPAVISADGRMLYFTRSNYYQRKLAKDAGNTSHLKLFRATRDTLGNWGDLHEFAYNGEDFSVGHPALSADGKTLYFASDRPGGFGGTDIWRSRDNGTGWSTPQNLGASVNTPGNELFPVINGEALYFSSTAHENMGGLDIFETHEQNGHWSDPLNMNFPINTVHDDFSFVLDEKANALGTNGASGYLSSDRDGRDNVYTFWLNEHTFYVDGTVKDDSSRFLPNTTVTLTELLTQEDTSMITGPDGKFRFKLKPNTDYSVKAEHEDAISQSRSISTNGLTRSDTIRVDLGLNSLVIDQPIAVKNIYYDLDKWDIRPDAAVELDKLARLFKDNPGLSFELSSHTDSRGGDNYNLVLSDARAHSAVNYLIQQGVDPDRLTGKGYGETQLVNQCSNGVKCTEEAHQANRRTEFKVVGIKDFAQKR